MGKVTIVSPPREWPLPNLPKRTVYYDPVHGELIGAEVELPGDVREVPVTDDTGAYTDAEPIGFRDEEEIVGDDEGDEEEDYEDTHEEGVEEPEDDAPDPGASPDGEVMQMGPDDESPGPSGPPSFISVPGAVAPATAPASAIPGAAAKAVATSVANFRGKLMRQDPGAIAALNKLRVMAPMSPLHAAVLKVVVKKPLPKSTAKKSVFTSIRPRSRGNVKVMGAAIPVHAVSRAASAIIKLALSPVAWAGNTVGTVTKEVGNQLQGLARKL